MIRKILLALPKAKSNKQKNKTSRNTINVHSPGSHEVCVNISQAELKRQKEERSGSSDTLGGRRRVHLSSVNIDLISVAKEFHVH